MATFDLELIPGLMTSRAAVAASYGGATYGGIEPAVDAKMVLVYSDPAAGAKHGYTFDGQAEDDEHGALYLYTGEGKGDQKFTDGNASLLRYSEDGRTVHLFVADGFVPHPVTGKKTGAKQQRYIGQMVLDAAKPFEKMRAPGPDGDREVIVFRMRPDPAALHAPIFLPTDAISPAPGFGLVEVEVEPEEVEPAGPAGPAVTQVETEEHATDETVANIPGGIRTVVRWEGQLVAAYKAFLVAQGHEVKSFQITVEGVRGPLRTDLYDVTDNVLYEAKGTVRRNDVRMAIGQLLDYRRHIGAPAGLRLAVLLPGDPGEDLRALLADVGIAVVTRTTNGFDGFPLA